MLVGRVAPVAPAGGGGAGVSELDLLHAENARLRAQIERLEALATTDPLTGLGNRRCADARLDELFSASARHDADLTCLMIDLDGLKRVNDALGHAEGDRMIRLAADVLTGTIRKSDFAARVGGDEFLVLLPQTTAATATILAERLVNRFESACEDLAARLTTGAFRDHADLNAEVAPTPLRVHVTLGASGGASNSASGGASSGAASTPPESPTRTSRPGLSIGLASRLSSDAQAPTDLTAAADRALYSVKAAKHASAIGPSHAPQSSVRVYVPVRVANQAA